MQAGLVRFLLRKGWVATAKAATNFWGKEKSSFFPPLIFITLLNEMRVFGCLSSLFLSLSWVILGPVPPTIPT